MKQRLIVKLLFLVMIVSALIFSSCKELSNEKSDDTRFVVDMAHIKNQLEGPGTNAITGSGGAKGLVIGAIVVTSRDTPYSSGETLTEAEEDTLVDELINSLNYITIANLPIAADFIEFLIPPDTAAHWQVVVIATSNSLSRLDDVDADLITHTGFSTKFYESSTLGSEVVQINMQVHVQ